MPDSTVVAARWYGSKSAESATICLEIGILPILRWPVVMARGHGGHGHSLPVWEGAAMSSGWLLAAHCLATSPYFVATDPIGLALAAEHSSMPPLPSHAAP